MCGVEEDAVVTIVDAAAEIEEISSRSGIAVHFSFY